MSTVLKDLEVKAFLTDFEANSEVELLEEGKERLELEKRIKAMGLKNSKDLGFFKTIYAFTDKPNANGAILPKKELLKVLPGIINKPVNKNHERNIVLGHYFDYRYIAKESKVIAYGVFYKSYFPELWENAKELREKGKLSSSFEIWSPTSKRKVLADGSYELYQMEIAGGALVFEDKQNTPAFKDAKVLELAKISVELGLKDLVKASKYKCKDLIIHGNLECSKCGNCPNSLTNVIDKTENINTKITCSNCKHEWEISSQPEYKMGTEKCPKCFAILKQDGTMIYPPQIVDFKMLCPPCKISNWLIINRTEDEAKLRCITCKKEYRIEFAKKKENPITKNWIFVYSGVVSCYQCNNNIEINGVSAVKKRILTCNKCGLKFQTDISLEKYKAITKIEEIIKAQKETKVEKSSDEGGKKEEMFELTKYHRYVSNLEEAQVKMVAEESEGLEEAKRLTTEERNALPDNLFALVVRVKDKRSGDMRKIRMFPIHDEAHVRNALARLGQDRVKKTITSLGVSIEKVRAKILRRAKELNMTELLERQKTGGGLFTKEELKKQKATPKVKAIEPVKVKVEIEETKVETSKEKLYKQRIHKVVSLAISQREEIAKIKKEMTEKIAFYKDNAKKVISRRIELGEEFAKDLSDEDLLNDDKFENAKLKKDNVLLKAKAKTLTTSSESVGDKVEESIDDLAKKRAKVNEHAFGN